ncbi:MAG: DNA helicase RecQ [Oscillospiraceae bacterium]|nr:DNA helicase RecQ [Oscillospiraceae bacterium]
MRDKFSILEQIFGYKAFRGGQEEIIDAILSGQDALAIMPTGAGKSICYQVPALLLDGITLVVSPLISLMKDQVGSLGQAGVRAAYINSSLTASQVDRVLEELRYGTYRLCYVAPERLLNSRFLETVFKLDIALVAVDEAHCVSQWGQDFRPSYLEISRFIEALPERPVVAAFTATATQQVRRDMEALLELRDPLGVTTGFDRENLYFEVQRPHGRMDAAVRFVEERRGKSGIVYCLTRKDVEQVEERLVKAGIPATRYHAGLSDEERRRNQEAFQADECPVMVATNAFGMGIDKSNVTYVLHVGMPKNLESYYQEAGRAGRDGAPAECVLLYAEKDIALNTFLIQRDSEEQEGMDADLLELLVAQDRARLSSMVGYCKTTTCLRRHILSYFDEPRATDCGNCANCKQTFAEVDITVEAQKILSCVKRMDERFGKVLVSEVLKGKETGKPVEFGLHRLSTYGVLRDLTGKRILELIDALVAMDYLYVTETDIQRGVYPVVKLGPKARAVLFDGATVLMRVSETASAEPKKRGRKKRAEIEEMALANDDLFEKLRGLRTELARAQGVPPYVIFHDATLVEMSEVMPETEADFLEISGVGQRKFERYGAEFLAVIRGHLG